MDQKPAVEPVELLVFTFPGVQVPTRVGQCLQRVFDSGCVTVLDLVHLAKDDNGYVRQIEAGDPLDEVGLFSLPIASGALLSDHDLTVVTGSVPCGCAAVVLVYEQSWARRLATEVLTCGGRVDLHLQLPPTTRDPADTAVAERLCGARAAAAGLLTDAESLANRLFQRGRRHLRPVTGR